MATLADLLAIPEEERRHEIVDGVLVQKEAATGAHGRAQLRLSRRLGPYATEVEVQFEENQIFRPDVTGWRRERLPDLPKQSPITVVPDWICEILSSNRSNDLVRKKRVYHRHRVGHYWLIDPDEETLSVLRWSADGYVEVLNVVRKETVRAEPFAEMELPMGVLFGDDEQE